MLGAGMPYLKLQRLASRILELPAVTDDVHFYTSHGLEYRNQGFNISVLCHLGVVMCDMCAQTQERWGVER